MEVFGVPLVVRLIIDAPRQRGCVMAVNSRAADNQRDLFAFWLEPDLGVFQRPPLPSTFPSMDEVCAENVAAKATAQVRRRLAISACDTSGHTARI